MSTFYSSENIDATWQDGGFLEIVPREGHAFAHEDRVALYNKLAEANLPAVRVLISRYHYYPPPKEYSLWDIGSLEKIHIARVAYFTPSPISQTLSHLVGVTALKSVPYQVFSERDAAIAWLLSEETGTAATAAS
jgi:hypothetical protein